jgi:hypothetical protein
MRSWQPCERAASMALIVRIDVDRPYGKSPFLRHVFSRLSSDIYFPRIATFGYLRELKLILQMLNAAGAQAYVFFRRCTLPTRAILELIDSGGHEIGLHLENSRSFDTFKDEKALLERHIGRPVTSVSKHGSGKRKHGFHHYAPYEPDKYIAWAQKSGMKVFLGNLEDPTIPPSNGAMDLKIYPSAFWLEPSWRDTRRFTVKWLLSKATTSDVVLLMHPDNVLADPSLTADLRSLLNSLETRLLT